MLSGNKGEWSEIYALLKIITDKVLYRGDGDLVKVMDGALPIIKVIREELDGTYEYELDEKLVIINGAGNSFEIPLSDFQSYTKLMLSKIKAGGEASFSIPEIETFVSTFNCKSLKAKSKVKSDIHVILHDLLTGTKSALGFSIKSRLGNPSTLLNPGETTNFIYRIVGESFTTAEMNTINAIDTKSKVKDRLKVIIESGRSLKFIRPEKSTFTNNLVLIDSALPQILGHLVLNFFTSKNNSLIELLNQIDTDNPLNFDTNSGHPYYSYKIKRLLSDIALGMMP